MWNGLVVCTEILFLHVFRANQKINPKNMDHTGCLEWNKWGILSEMDAFIIHAKPSLCSACLDLFRDWLVSVENIFFPISVNQKQLDPMEAILEDRSNENY